MTNKTKCSIALCLILTLTIIGAANSIAGNTVPLDTSIIMTPADFYTPPIPIATVNFNAPTMVSTHEEEPQMHIIFLPLVHNG